MREAAARSTVSIQPPKSEEKTGTTLEPEDETGTGWCLRGCLPHQCGDQAERFLKAKAADELPEVEETSCDWENWAAKIDNRPAPSCPMTSRRTRNTTAKAVFLFESHANAWGSVMRHHIFDLNRACLMSRPSFGRQAYIQPLDLSDAASEGESKSKHCLAGLPKGLCVCI